MLYNDGGKKIEFYEPNCEKACLQGYLNRLATVIETTVLSLEISENKLYKEIFPRIKYQKGA